MRVDIRVPVGAPLPELAGFAQECEQAGLNGIAVHDHSHAGRDVFCTLTLMAAATSRLSLYPATCNPTSRDPLVLAASTGALAEAAPGRDVFLSLSSGYRSGSELEKPKATRGQLRETVSAVRGLLGGEAVALGGAEERLLHPPAGRLPVYVLAGGPKMLELAGEVADGVLLFVGLHPDAVREARHHLRVGAERAGRDPDAIAQIFVVHLAVGAPEEVRRWPRTEFSPGVPFLSYPSPMVRHWLARSGVELPDEADGGGVTERAAAAVCRDFGLFGPPEHCADRLRQAEEEAGIGRVLLFPCHVAEHAYRLPRAEVAHYARTIGPRLAGA